MILSTDIGSLPLENNQEKFDASFKAFKETTLNISDTEFEQKILKSFIDKLNAGIDVPNFPQFRDMNRMFLQLIEGLEKVEGGYIETETLRLKNGKGIIAEMEVLRRNASKIAEETRKPVKTRFCITGPYTLSCLFTYRNAQTFRRLGTILTEILEQNLFREKHCAVVLVSIDEPAFGFIDDPLLDRGSEGRETLLKAWETMFHAAAAKNVETCLHLHSTSDELFWEAKSLKILDSHVNDPLYRTSLTKQKLEAKDKFLKASICITEFDTLIRKKLETTRRTKVSTQQIGETWKKITRGTLDPRTFIENVDVMKTRLQKTVNFFGVERIPYAGPECGLGGFPTYECAIECLKRVATAIKAVR